MHLRSPHRFHLHFEARRNNLQLCKVRMSPRNRFPLHSHSKFRQYMSAHIRTFLFQLVFLSVTILLVAMKGNARGRIKTVFGVRDIAKVKSGDIMVSTTTHPDYISAMHRAAAIVTDEGGLTSHAAIVSRELRIPCIVGTRIGTRIFKDGDLVEVDAQKGIVRKL